MTCVAPVLLGSEVQIYCSTDPTSVRKDPQAAPVPANLGRVGQAAAGRVSMQCCEVLQVPGSVAQECPESSRLLVLS